MTKSKDIGKAFKEKFDDLDTTPSSLEWESIEPKLAKTKNYNLFYWFLISGVFAVSVVILIIALHTTISVDQSNNSINKTVSSQEDCEPGTFSSNNNILKDHITLKLQEGYTAKTKKDIINDVKNSTLKSGSNKIFPLFYFYSSQNDSNYTVLSASNSNLIKREKRITSAAKTNSRKKSSLKDPVFAENKNLESSTFKNSNINNLDKAEKIITSTPDKVSDTLSLVINDTVKTLSVKKRDTLIKIKRLTNKPFQRFIATVHADLTYLIVSKGSIVNNGLSENAGNGRLDVGFGLLFSSYLTEEIALRIGYSRLNISSNIKNVTDSQLASTLYYFESKNTTNSILYKMKYDELIFGLQYLLSDRKIQISGITEISAQLLKASKIIINTNEHTIKNNPSSKKFNLGLSLGSNLSYKLYDKISLIVEPIIQFSITERTNDGGNIKPVNIRVRTGVSYEF